MRNFLLHAAVCYSVPLYRYYCRLVIGRLVKIQNGGREIPIKQPGG